jgi:hypothetical protein
LGQRKIKGKEGMPTTHRQDQSFIAEVVPKDLLEQSLDWIRSNMEPEDVFGEDRLIEWAKDNYEE